MESNDHPFFVTSRVIEERFWLHPILTCGAEPPNRHARRLHDRLKRHADKRLAALVARVNKNRDSKTPKLTIEIARKLAKDLAGAALARAQELYDVKVFAFVVMSNHFHLLCQTRNKNLARFMGYLKARLTDTINMLTGKRGPLWARRYDAEPVIDDEGCADRAGYTVGNPRQANLVEDAQEWPGLNLAFGVADDNRLTFTYLDRTAWQRAKRPDDLQPFLKQATLVLSPIPGCEGMSPELYRQSLKTWMAQAHAKVQARKRDEKPTDEHNATPQRPKPVLGLDAIIQAPFHARPKSASFRRRPYAHGQPDGVRAHKAAAMLRIQEYDECADRYRAGELDVAFPEGMYRPPLMTAA